jgi:hypothetical protein
MAARAAGVGATASSIATALALLNFSPIVYHLKMPGAVDLTIRARYEHKGG